MSWPMVALSEALESAEIFTDGDWVESRDQDPDGDVRLIQMADVGVGHYLDRSARFLTSETARRLKCTYLQNGDLLVSRMPDPLGRCCIFPGDTRPSVTVVDVCVVRPDVRVIEPRWLMHCLNSPTSNKRMNQYATGTTRARISRKNLGRVKVQLPPVAEQRRIAEILDCADALRTRRRQSLACHDQLTRIAYLEALAETSLWRSLGELGINFATGKNVVGSDFNSHPTNRVIKVSAISSGRFDPTEIKPLPADYLPPRAHRISRGDFLFGRASGSIELLGATAVVDTDVEDHYLPDKVWRLEVPDGAPVLRSFVLGVLRSDDFRSFVKHNASGAAGVRNIGKNRVLSFLSPLPPMAVQQRYSQVMARAGEGYEMMIRSAQHLDELFASLQFQAFSGKL